MTERDRLFEKPVDHVAGFRFDAEVARVFPDMINRSVPGYQTIVAMTGTLSERYVQDNTHCYDLGCSLGAAALAMSHGIRAEGCQIVAVDNSEQMIERCKLIIDSTRSATPIKVLHGDILDTAIDNASMVVMNFTLQFIEPRHRTRLIQRIYQGLRPGGIFVLSEKIAFADAQLNDLMIDLHHAFKRANQYSDLEISQKRSALEEVLIPQTLDVHRSRLLSAGFNSIDVWFQCFNFASLLAIK